MKLGKIEIRYLRSALVTAVNDEACFLHGHYCDLTGKPIKGYSDVIKRSKRRIMHWNKLLDRLDA